VKDQRREEIIVDSPATAALDRRRRHDDVDTEAVVALGG
jgi:hypothetical protein